MIPQNVIDLFDEFTHGGMDRRDFMQRLARMAGGTGAAAALLPHLEVQYAHAERVNARAAGLQESYRSYAGASGEVRAYLARPAGVGPFPAVMVIHENRGLNPHIEDVARRAAVAGFLAIAPDALSPLGGTPEDADQARTLMRELDAAVTQRDFVAGVSFLDDHEASTGRVGCVGFCWGGAMANQMAVQAPDLDAAVAFYGRQPDAGEVGRIKAAVLLHYAGLDERINAGIDAHRAALEAAGVDYRLHMYEGANHAFHNDTAPTRYNAAAAELAWRRTIEFFREKLA